MRIFDTYSSQFTNDDSPRYFLWVCIFLCVFSTASGCLPDSQTSDSQQNTPSPPSHTKTPSQNGLTQPSLDSCPKVSVILGDRQSGNLQVSIPIPELQEPLIAVRNTSEPDDLFEIQSLTFESLPLKYSLWHLSQPFESKPHCPIKVRQQHTRHVLTGHAQNEYVIGMMSKTKLMHLLQDCELQVNTLGLQSVQYQGQELYLDLKIRPKQHMPIDALVTQGHFFVLQTQRQKYKLHVSFHISKHQDQTEIKVQDLGLECGQFVTLEPS